MTTKQRAHYRLAAEALAAHLCLDQIKNPQARGIAIAAFNKAAIKLKATGRLAAVGIVRMVDDEVVRMLRECLKKDEVMT